MNKLLLPLLGDLDKLETVITKMLSKIGLERYEELILELVEKTKIVKMTDMGQGVH